MLDISRIPWSGSFSAISSKEQLRRMILYVLLICILQCQTFLLATRSAASINNNEVLEFLHWTIGPFTAKLYFKSIGADPGKN